MPNTVVVHGAVQSCPRCQTGYVAPDGLGGLFCVNCSHVLQDPTRPQPSPIASHIVTAGVKKYSLGRCQYCLVQMMFDRLPRHEDVCRERVPKEVRN